MARALRGLLLGSIALAFAYLIVHAREPLRLNVGDAWSDARVVAAVTGDFAAPSLVSRHYIAVGKLLGISDISTFRLIAIAWSGLGMWLLFAFVRRLYSDRIALIATALFGTSRLWMMYADSLDHVPMMTALMFLGLWGLVRAIDTKQPHYYAAAALGSFGAFFTSYDCITFLPTAVLVTVYLKLGNPFTRGNRHFVAICAAACMLAVVVKSLTTISAVGWDAFVANLELDILARTTSPQSKFQYPPPTLVRRLTLAFTPFFLIAGGFHLLRAIRAPNLSAAIKDTAVWMLLAAVAFLLVFRQHPTSQLLTVQAFLPFYAVGSALLVDWMLERANGWQHVAFAWLIAAPLWSFFALLTHPRSLLDRGDVAKTRAYLAANDHNDFVVSNLTSEDPIHAAFQRHGIMLDAGDPYDAAARMMRVFESTGTDTVHQLVFTDRHSRFIDRSSYVFTARSRTKSAGYERRVKKNLEAVGAATVLKLRNYSVYRIDRAAVMAQLARAVETTDRIEFDQLAASRHLLPGWSAPRMTASQVAVTSLEGVERCEAATTTPGNRCKTSDTSSGVRVNHARPVFAGQLMVRVDRVCDLQLTFAFATYSHARFSINGFTVTSPGGPTATFTVPAANVTTGGNVIEVESLLHRWIGVHLVSLDVRPACPAP